MKFIRQPALRIFAAELAESKQTIYEYVEGREFETHYQLTPTHDMANRVFMMGTLLEVDPIGTSGNSLRGRIVDPTGVFNVYAGQYQPEALSSLSSIIIPSFVAVIGKTSAYKPDEETTIVSIRPETILEIDARTRDHWIKETIVMTLIRVEKSHLSDAEKEKYRKMCKGALTALTFMPRETGMSTQKDKNENTFEKNGVASPQIDGSVKEEIIEKTGLQKKKQHEGSVDNAFNAEALLKNGKKARSVNTFQKTLF